MDNITTQDLEKLKRALPNIEKMSEFLGKIDGNYVTREEVVNLFKIYNDVLKEMRKLMEKSISDEKNDRDKKMGGHKSHMESIELNINKLGSDLRLTKKEIDSTKKEITRLIYSEIESIQEQIPYEVDFSEMYEYIDNANDKIQALILKQIKNDINPQYIRDSLEKLRGNERLDKSAIKGLEEEFKRIEGKSNNTGVIFGSKKTMWAQTTLVGTIDSSNRVFTFEGKVPAQYSERVFLNYMEQNPLTDYVISGRTVTYTVAPDISLSGQSHIIRYAY